MKKEVKRIRCYICGRKGIVRLRKQRYGISDMKVESFKMISQFSWLCEECDKSHCVRCGILLSNKYRCEQCGEKHGAFYDYFPEFCKECLDYLKEHPNESRSKWCIVDKGLDKYF